MSENMLEQNVGKNARKNARRYVGKGCQKNMSEKDVKKYVRQEC